MITENQILLAVFRAEYHWAILVDGARNRLHYGGENLDTTHISYIKNVLAAMYIQIDKNDFTSETTIYFYNELLDFLASYTDDVPLSDPNYQYPEETVIIIDSGVDLSDYVKRTGAAQTIDSVITFNNPISVPDPISSDQAINLGKANLLYQPLENQRLSTTNFAQFLAILMGIPGVGGIGLIPPAIQISGADNSTLRITKDELVFTKSGGGVLHLLTSTSAIPNGNVTQTFQNKTGTIALLIQVPIRGAVFVQPSTSNVITVNIGTSQFNSGYAINISPLNLETAVNWYMSAQTTSTFEVTFLGPVITNIAFNWTLTPYII